MTGAALLLRRHVLRVCVGNSLVTRRHVLQTRFRAHGFDSQKYNTHLATNTITSMDMLLVSRDYYSGL